MANDGETYFSVKCKDKDVAEYVAKVVGDSLTRRLEDGIFRVDLDDEKENEENRLFNKKLLDEWNLDGETGYKWGCSFWWSKPVISEDGGCFFVKWSCEARANVLDFVDRFSHSGDSILSISSSYIGDGNHTGVVATPSVLMDSANSSCAVEWTIMYVHEG